MPYAQHVEPVVQQNPHDDVSDLYSDLHVAVCVVNFVLEELFVGGRETPAAVNLMVLS